MKKILLYLATLAWALLIWRLTTTPDFSVTDDTILSFILSNGGHFIFFGILCALILFALPPRIWNLSSSILAVAGSSLYGIIIELVQRNIPGRSADPFDWLLDTLGALTFLAIINKYINHKS